MALLCGSLSYFLTPSELPSSLAIIGKTTLEGFNKKKDIHFFYGYVFSFVTLGLLFIRIEIFRSTFHQISQWLSNPPSKDYGRFLAIGHVCSIFALTSLGLYGLKMLIGRLFFVNLEFSKELTTVLHIALLSITVIWAKLTKPKLTEHTKTLLLYSQIPISFLFLTLIPLSLTKSLRDFLIFPNALLASIALGLIFWNALWVLRKRHSYLLNSYAELISPLSAFAVLLLLHSAFHYYPYLSTDDYHMGEQYLPYWLVKKFGSVLYNDYLPAHGLINISPMAIGDLLWQSISVENMIHGSFIQHILVLAYAFAGFYLLSNTTFAFLFLATPFLFKDSFFLIAGTIAFLSHWYLKKSYGKILTIGIPILGFLALFELSVGISFTAGLGPFIILSTYECWKESKFKTLPLLIVGILFLFSILYTLPINYLGLIRSLLENSSSNLFGYGIAWKESFTSDWANSLFNAAIRSLWLLVLPLILIGIYIKWTPFNRSRKTILQAMLLFWFAAGSILIHGYALGRIDPGAISRNGYITQMLIGILFPIFLMTDSTPVVQIPRGLALYIVAALSLNGTIRPSYNFSFANFPTVSTFGASTHDLEILTTQKKEFKNIGFIGTDENHISQIRDIKSTLEMFKSTSPTFIDLTNHNAYYFYLDIAPVTDITSYYNLAHPSQRARFLEKIKKYGQKVIVLVGPEVALHDGIPFWIRCPELGDYLLNNQDFVFVKIGNNNYIIGRSLLTEEISTNTSTLDRKDVTPEIKTETSQIGIKHIKGIVSPFIFSLLQERLPQSQTK